MEEVRYNTIGKDYNTTRKADPYIAAKIFDLLKPPQGGLFLDIGCGTGNYLHALSQKGLSFIGVDPSEVMLAVARMKNTGTTFLQATAEQLPFPNIYFDGAIAVLTLHHWNDIGKGLKELYKVLKPGGRLVSFSFTPQQLNKYWLHYYFPKMIERSALTIPAWDKMQLLFSDAGFSEIITEPYFVREDLQDHFLYSHKSRPEKYLESSVRSNISSFAAFSDSEELQAGLHQMKMDIDSGKIKQVMHEYENNIGDYLFVSMIK